MTYREVVGELGPLLTEYARSRHIHPPFWRLQHDGVWVIAGADELPQTDSGDVLTSALTDDHAGDFPGGPAARLQDDPGYRQEAIDIVADYLPLAIRAEVLGRLGLSTTHGDVAPHAQPADVPESAAELLRTLEGVTLKTASGRDNVVLAVSSPDVIVATDRSPDGQPVPIEQVQAGLDRLRDAGEIEVSVRELGHRSSFIGAVLIYLPGAVLIPATPPRIRLTDPVTAYRLEQAGPLNAWWAGNPAQRYWLEITDRPDIGVDLHCPQRDAAGARTPGYSLIWWVEPGDVVFHYDRNQHAITAWSRAAGPVTEAPTVWLSHHAATRRRLQTARAQPGWWLDLDGPFPLQQQLTLAQLRDRTDDIRAIHEALKAQVGNSLYFPFSYYAGSVLRPQQPYLNKLPAEFVGLFPELTAAVASAVTPAARPPAPGPGLGAPYREAQVSELPPSREPFTTDPALVEGGLRGRADTQNELAAVLRGAGLDPRSRRPEEPNFDLAWEADGVVFVAEVKSITDTNEEEQLRLGLGQVLRYRHRLTNLGYKQVVAVLVPERQPRDESWAELCRELDVVLLSRSEVNRAPMLASKSPEK